MALQIDWKLFVSTFVLIFVAELPDKTAFATLLLATRKDPLAIFIGVAIAFVIQSVVAVSFGSALGLLPRQWVSIGAAVLFMLFAFLMWQRKDHEEENLHLENQKSNFLRTIWSSFVVIFIAEWGDLTQLATATLAAEHKKPVTVFLAATLALGQWQPSQYSLVTGPKRSFTRSFFKRLQQEHLPWLELFFFFELEDSPHVGDSIPSLATSAPQQIP